MPRLPRKVPQRHQRPKPAQARHQSQPSAISVTPATQNEDGCDQVPRLPRETKVDVTKCHACHTKCRPPEPAQCSKCHACHAKGRWMWPSGTPPMRNEGGCHQAPRLPRLPRKVEGSCHQAPHLPRKVPRCERCWLTKMTDGG